MALISVCLVANTYAQAPEIPNADFEVWEEFSNYEDPEDWKSINSETSAFGSTLVEKSSDAHSGNYAARLETKNVLVTAPAAMSLGYIVELSFTDRDMQGGIPSSEAPESFEGYYKFSPVGNDFGFIACILFKYNDVEQKQDTVARALFLPTDETNEYTHFKVDMEYLTDMEGVQHDTMNVVISSSFKFGNPEVGTVLYVDDLKITYPDEGPNSVQNRESSKIMLYPNPTDGMFWIDNPKGNELRYEVLDITGKLIRSEVISNGNYPVDLSGHAAGVYFVRIEEEGIINTQKIILK